MLLHPSAVRLRVLSTAVAVWLACMPAAAATFRCAGGDVQCLIDAITVANGNGEKNTIRLSGDTYTVTNADNVGTSSIDANAFPVIGGNITIVGVAPDTTIIERVDNGRPEFDPNRNYFRFFTVAPTGHLALEGLTLRGGDTNASAGSAGAILSRGVLTLIQTVIANNRAGRGGAILIEAGKLVLRDSRVANNLVGFGNDIVAIGRVAPPSEPVSATIERTTVSDNAVAAGGAIGVRSGSSATITGTTVIRNSGSGTTQGGFYGVINVNDSAQSRVTIANSTIANNRFWLAALNAGPDSLVTNSTLVNSRPGSGSITTVFGGVRLQNSILASETLAGDCFNVRGFTSLGSNLIRDPHNCLSALQPSDLVGAPGLGPFVDDGRAGGQYFALLADSRAIDAGDLTVCPSTDQRGLARPIDGNGDGVRGCDIGSVEFYPVVNDLVRLDDVRSSFKKPNPNVEPYAAGGEYRITTTFTNINWKHICHVAFEVTTLQPASIAPALLTPNGDLIGREGLTVPATLLGSRPDLRPEHQERYRFLIGVTAPDPITFMVHVLGEPSADPCPRK